MRGLSFSELAAIHILRSFAAVNNGAGDIYSSCVKQGMRPEICYTIPAETPAMKRTLNTTRSKNERDGDVPIGKK